MQTVNMPLTLFIPMFMMHRWISILR